MLCKRHNKSENGRLSHNGSCPFCWGKGMKRLLAIIISLMLLCSLNVTAYAKPRLDVIKNGGFTALSDTEMQETIQALTDKIVKDCGVQRAKTVSCYDWEQSPVIAYNTIYCDIICVNLSGFRTTADADAANETVEYHLVKTLAHEVRHSYQYEHRLDGTDYGNACLLGFQTYEEYNGDRALYYQQFIEADAEQYAIDYANKYFKVVK